MPYSLNLNNVGISLVSNSGNGSTITLKWYRVFPTVKSNKIAYNIYMDTVRPDFENRFFDKTPVFVSVDGTLTTDIINLTPGQIYRFGVRGVEYDPTVFDLKTLPLTFNNLRSYPETLLVNNISKVSDTISLLSVDNFPSSGVIKIGAELIQYSSIDTVLNQLQLTNISLQRGFNNTVPAIHTTTGFDGYVNWDPHVLFFPIASEDRNTVVFATEDRFDYDKYPFNVVDGYRQVVKDIVNADLSVVEQINDNFPSYDYAGWHRTDPVALLNGECVGSYFGGQRYCADGYDGVGRMLRGISAQDANTQRQEVLLSVTGEPVVLVRRQWLGIQCFCVLTTQQMPDASCKKCLGTGTVVGYSQFFSDRRSDSRIMMRFEAWSDELPLVESGLQVEATKPSAWTLVWPPIRKRDFIVRFDQDGNEEFRYEVVGVTRNILLNQNFGGQKLSLQRIRKTDQIYKVRVFRDTSTIPSILTTNVASPIGVGPHKHTFHTNEKPPSSWNQITSVDAGHSHVLSWDGVSGTLKISEELQHSHVLVY